MLSLVFVDIFPQIETNPVKIRSSSSLGELKTGVRNAGRNGSPYCVAPCSTQPGLKASA